MLYYVRLTFISFYIHILICEFGSATIDFRIWYLASSPIAVYLNFKRKRGKTPLKVGPLSFNRTFWFLKKKVRSRWKVDKISLQTFSTTSLTYFSRDNFFFSIFFFILDFTHKYWESSFLVYIGLKLKKKKKKKMKTS